MNALRSHELRVDHERWRWARPLLLFSDIDDTMVGASMSADRNTAKFTNIWRLAQGAERRTLVYNTGRSLASVQRIMQQKQPVMPQPDHLICGVGTRIYTCDLADNKLWCEDEEWTQYISHGWDVAIVKNVLNDLIRKHGKNRVRFTSSCEQHTHKQTLQVDSCLLTVVVDTIKHTLDRHGVQHLLVSGSSEEEPDPWGFVDVLPARAGKGNAAEWVRAEVLGGQYSPDLCVVAGDSHNDKQALEDPRWNAIVVGNAIRSLRQWALKQEVKQRTANMSGDGDDDGEQAAGVTTDVGGVNTDIKVVAVNGSVAEGVLEGLIRLSFLK